MVIDMKIHMAGIPALKEKLANLDATMQHKIVEAMKFEGEGMKNIARARCPVKTGFLRDSIYVRVDEVMHQILMNLEFGILRLGATAPYAIYQELGTRYISPRHFLKNAVWLRMQSLINRINRAIGESIKETST